VQVEGEMKESWCAKREETPFERFESGESGGKESSSKGRQSRSKGTEQKHSQVNSVKDTRLLHRTHLLTCLNGLSLLVA
jgi:hypothetical protein